MSFKSCRSFFSYAFASLCTAASLHAANGGIKFADIPASIVSSTSYVNFSATNNPYSLFKAGSARYVNFLLASSNINSCVELKTSARSGAPAYYMDTEIYYTDGTLDRRLSDDEGGEHYARVGIWTGPNFIPTNFKIGAYNSTYNPTFRGLEIPKYDL
jgi:hypothetical protein